MILRDFFCWLDTNEGNLASAFEVESLALFAIHKLLSRRSFRYFISADD